MTFKPNKDRLLVRRKEVEKYTPSGLLIPDSAQSPQVEAEIISSGDAGFHPGQTVVLTNKYAGTPIKLNGEDLLIVRVDDGNSEVLGVME